MFRALMKSLPPIRKLLDERDALTQELALSKDAAGRMRESIAQHEADAQSLTELLSPYQTAARERRLIITDYACEPKQRQPLEWLADRFEREVDAYRDTLRVATGYVEALKRIAINHDMTTSEPLWSNPWFAPLDGAMLYALIAKHNPGRYVEVGSGHSTRFARRAINDTGNRTQIVSIDPHPQSSVGGLADEQITSSLELMPADFWRSMRSDDILFFDGSHRSFQNSDVTVFFTEILPTLPSGMIYGIHDICLPEDYPAAWSDRFYNEQYLLTCYLLGGAAGDRILLPSFWASQQPDLHNLLEALWGSLPGLETHGGAFWMQRA